MSDIEDSIETIRNVFHGSLPDIRGRYDDKDGFVVKDSDASIDVAEAHESGLEQIVITSEYIYLDWNVEEDE